MTQVAHDIATRRAHLGLVVTDLEEVDVHALLELAEGRLEPDAPTFRIGAASGL